MFTEEQSLYAAIKILILKDNQNQFSFKEWSCHSKAYVRERGFMDATFLMVCFPCWSSPKTINICFATVFWTGSSTKIRTISIIKTSFRTGISNIIFQSIKGSSSNTLIMLHIISNYIWIHTFCVNTWTAKTSDHPIFKLQSL